MFKRFSNRRRWILKHVSIYNPEIKNTVCPYDTHLLFGVGKYTASIYSKGWFKS